jgi:hypothetical protein
MTPLSLRVLRLFEIRECFEKSHSCPTSVRHHSWRGTSRATVATQLLVLHTVDYTDASRADSARRHASARVYDRPWADSAPIACAW